MSEIASKFRDLMSEGMLYGHHGQYRKEFYDDVVARAKVRKSLRLVLYCGLTPLDSSQLLKEHSPNSIVDSSPTRMLSIQDEHGQPT